MSKSGIRYGEEKTFCRKQAIAFREKGSIVETSNLVQILYQQIMGCSIPTYFRR